MCALVTGVQTCALPIYESCRGDRGHKRLVLSNYGQQRSSAWISRIRTRVTRGQPTAANADDDKHVIEPLTIRDRRRSEEHTSELQSLMRISYAVFCLKKKTNKYQHTHTQSTNSKHNKTRNN